MERNSIQYQGNDCPCSEVDLARSPLLNHIQAYKGRVRYAHMSHYVVVKQVKIINYQKNAITGRSYVKWF